jgi:hypothetical protein
LQAKEGAKMIIGRYDKVDLTIKNTRANTENLYSNHSKIAEAIAEAIGGTLGKPKPTNKETEKGYQWKQTIRSQEATVVFYSPKKHRTKDGELEPNIDSMGKMQFTSRNKWDYTPHYVAIGAAHEIFGAFGLSYHVGLTELALDTLVKEEAEKLARSAKLKWAKGATFNFQKGIREEGGSDQGQEEYQNHRPQSRQKHTYYKPDFHFWRSEMIFRRKYLSKSRVRPGGIHTVPDLFESMEDLLQKNLSFVRLKTAKLYREHPALELLGLEKMSPNAVLCILTQALNKSRGRIEREYFEKIEGPYITIRPILTTI